MTELRGGGQEFLQFRVADQDAQGVGPIVEVVPGLDDLAEPAGGAAQAIGPFAALWGVLRLFARCGGALAGLAQGAVGDAQKDFGEAGGDAAEGDGDEVEGWVVEGSALKDAAGAAAREEAEDAVYDERQALGEGEISHKAYLSNVSVGVKGVTGTFSKKGKVFFF